MVAEFFQRDGWAVDGGTFAASDNPALLVKAKHYDAVGFSLATGLGFNRLQDCISAIRQTVSPKKLCIIVGGPYFAASPEKVSEVGADLFANAVAAHASHVGPCVVVDFGTATTIDAVSADGEFLGGVIAPGVDSGLDALSQRAARLMRVELASPPAAIGRNTVESMQSGLVLGAASMVDGMVARISGEMGAQPVVVATGGLAPLVIPHSVLIEEHEPMLTLEGLRIVHERTVGAPARSRRR
jgi:pantothenate kinase type III